MPAFTLPISRSKCNAFFLGILLLLAATAVPDAFAQRPSEEARALEATPAPPASQATDARPSAARPGKGDGRPATPAMRRAQLRRHMLQQPVSTATRRAASVHVGGFDGTAVQEKDRNETWWYVMIGGTAVLSLLSLATGTAALLSGEEGESGQGIPPPPERP
jgi:hypothetical protein